MHADKVYFLNKPDQILVASAKELLKDNPAFYELFAAQTNECPPDKGNLGQEEAKIYKVVD
jgi:hypothetical protein